MLLTLREKSESLSQTASFGLPVQPVFILKKSLLTKAATGMIITGHSNVTRDSFPVQASLASQYKIDFLVFLINGSYHMVGLIKLT